MKTKRKIIFIDTDCQFAHNILDGECMSIMDDLNGHISIEGPFETIKQAEQQVSISELDSKIHSGELAEKSVHSVGVETKGTIRLICEIKRIVVPTTVTTINSTTTTRPIKIDLI